MTKTVQPIRLTSADVYRGFVMFLMMAEVLQFEHVSEALPDSTFWQFLTYHQSHVEWIGCSLHDLIQPSFSFLVGLVLPYSLTNRLMQSSSQTQIWLHTLWRSFILVGLGIFLRSQHAQQTYFTFEDTLTQIGLGYPILFLLGCSTQRTQLSTLVVILIGYWATFVLYVPTLPQEVAQTGVANDWPHHLQGFTAHWEKNYNLAWAFDRWFLNLFPRKNPFLFNRGGYATLSFIPTLGTMLLGLLAGNILKSTQSINSKLITFLICGFGGIGLGMLISSLGICPNVKRIWTPSWVLFSGGWCFLLLTFFYLVVDIFQQKRAFFMLKVIGMNSIAAYVIAETMVGYIGKALTIHLGQHYATIFGDAYQSLVRGSLILLLEWLILYWLYKRNIFIKV
ncbi:MAG: DUF5009 domain-containing protein [Spirosomataceae bacterium]